MLTLRRLWCLLVGHRSHALFLPECGLSGGCCRRCGWVVFCDCPQCRSAARSLRRGHREKGNPMLVWEKCGRGLWRSSCGRFDLLETGPADERYWVALDGDAGRVFRSYKRAECERWCAARAGG